MFIKCIDLHSPIMSNIEYNNIQIPPVIINKIDSELIIISEIPKNLYDSDYNHISKDKINDKIAQHICNNIEETSDSLMFSSMKNSPPKIQKSFTYTSFFNNVPSLQESMNISYESTILHHIRMLNNDNINTLINANAKYNNNLFKKNLIIINTTINQFTKIQNKLLPTDYISYQAQQQIFLYFQYQNILYQATYYDILHTFPINLLYYYDIYNINVDNLQDFEDTKYNKLFYDPVHSEEE